jgi:hypothetical protein
MRTSATDISTSSSSAKPAPEKLDRYLDFHFFTTTCESLSSQTPAFSIESRLGVGRLKDTPNGCIQQGVKLGIGLLGRQPLDQRPRRTKNALDSRPNGRRVSQGRFRVVGCGAFRLDFDGGLGGEAAETALFLPIMRQVFAQLGR